MTLGLGQVDVNKPAPNLYSKKWLVLVSSLSKGKHRLCLSHLEAQPCGQIDRNVDPAA